MSHRTVRCASGATATSRATVDCNRIQWEKLGAPLHLIITAKDAFYIGTRKGKLIVIGSNARGTAYAIMKLSGTQDNMGTFPTV